MPRTVTVDQIRTYLGLAVAVGGFVAARTDTKADDKLVDLLKRAQTNEPALLLLAALLSGTPPALPLLSVADESLVNEINANVEAIERMLAFAAAEHV